MHRFDILKRVSPDVHLMSDRNPLALAERFAPSVLLMLIGLFMLWVRLIPADRVITSSAVFYSGNDPWYHNRMVHYLVQHFPETTVLDPWSYFPFGTGYHSGFGGLFDQLIALAAIMAGLGSPTPHTVDVVTAYAPPTFGVLTVIPTYVLGRRLTNRWGGVIAAGLLALGGGGLFARTLVGSADHQSAEAFFGAMAVVGFAYTITISYRDSPMVEDVIDRDWRFLRTPIVAGGAGGVAVAAYLTMWAPGVMVLFTFGVFVVVQMARDHRAGRPTDHLAVATVTSMITTGVLTLLYARSGGLSSTSFSLLQPLAAFGLAAGAIALVALSRYAEREGYDREYYPPVVVGLLLVSLGVAWVVYPMAIDMLGQLFVRIYSFGYFTSVTAGTVVEIIPPSLNQVFAAYGMVLVLALLGAGVLVFRVWRENRPIHLLVLFWCFTMFSAYFTMARFGYYFSVVVAILGALGVWWAAKTLIGIDVDFDNLRSIDNVENFDIGMYQVLGLLVILLLIVPGNVVAISGQQPVWVQAENPALTGTDQAWYDGLNWLEDSSPEVPLGYYDQYDRPAGGDFDYPEGAYGVMSWWDYGHWITVMGERIPYANPFQQNPRPASAYFQATNETRANLIMDALPSRPENPNSVADLSANELQSIVDTQSEQADNENGRYVAIDHQMAAGKFSAITQWTGPGTNAYFQSDRYQFQGQNVSLPATTQRYEETMLARLYYDDAASLEHYRLVYEVERYSIVGGYLVQGQGVRPLRSLNIGQNWESVAPIAAQLQQSRRAGQLVSLGQGTNQYVYNARVESRVKLYERVEGATLTGTVPAPANASGNLDGTPVIAYVRLQTSAGRNFTYVQQTQAGPDGSFEMTVPYATDDSVSVADGGTNSSVSATTDYQIQAGSTLAPIASGSTTVPESAIYEGADIQVDLESTVNEDGDGSNESARLDPVAIDGTSVASSPPA